MLLAIVNFFADGVMREVLGAAQAATSAAARARLSCMPAPRPRLRRFVIYTLIAVPLAAAGYGACVVAHHHRVRPAR